MYVEMKTSLAGSRFSVQPGDVVEFDGATAKRLVDRGYAVEVAEEELIRTGAIEAPENASARTASRKSKK